MKKKTDKPSKVLKGNATQFFVAGELCRRGFAAVVTMGNTPNTDILCNNVEGTKCVHIQVKTYVPNTKKGGACPVGLKAEKDCGENFFWVLGGIPEPTDNENFEYYIIPSSVMAREVTDQHKIWARDKKAKRSRNEVNNMRTVHIPPAPNQYSWDISPYKNQWILIINKLQDKK